MQHCSMFRVVNVIIDRLPTLVPTYLEPRPRVVVRELCITREHRWKDGEHHSDKHIGCHAVASNDDARHIAFEQGLAECMRPTTRLV